MNAELIDMLTANDDGKGEPLFTMPIVEPLLKQSESYYLSAFTSSFSIGKSVQTKIADFIDKPKWNEITFMAQLHETLASKLGALRSEDVRKHVMRFEKWEELIKDDRLQRIKKCISNKQLQQHREHECINASLFFSLLFVDHEFNTNLNIDKKLVIANALTFATWKERMECDILRNTQLGNAFRENIFYKTDKEAHTQAFLNFCSGDKEISRRAISDTMSIIEISPWAGLEAAMHIVHEAIASNKKNVYGPKGSADRLLRKILLSDFLSDPQVYSIEKRRNEDQWFLIEILTLLPPKIPKLKSLTQEIEQLVHANVAVDTQGGMDIYSQRGVDFIQSVKEDPKVRKQMQNVSVEIQEYASTTLAAIISKTGEKLIKKTVHYFIFLPFFIQIYREWQGHGLYASLQYSLEHTFKSVKDLLLST